MEVKSFHNNDLGVLAFQINEFIKDKDIIDIKFSSAGIPAPENASRIGVYDYSALVLIK